MFVTRHYLISGKCLLAALLLIFITPIQTRAAISDTAASGLKPLILQLADPGRDKRLKAAYRMKQYGQDALPVLLETIREDDEKLRRGSILGILAMPYPALGMDALLEALGDTDSETRSLAARGLAIIGTPAAPQLVTRLASPNDAVRNAAGFSLKLMRSKAVPALIDGLDNENEFVKAKSAWLLGRMGADAAPAVPALIRALDAADIRVVHIVAEAIDLIGAPPGLVAHQLMMLNADTIGCPARRVGGNAAPLLVQLLNRPGTPLGQAAYHTIAFIGRPAMPALMRGVRNGHVAKRVACALLILNIDPDATDELPQDVLAAIRHAQRQPQQ